MAAHVFANTGGIPERSVLFGDITLLLQNFDSANPRIWDALLQHVYPQLRRIAGYQVSRESDQSALRATELVDDTVVRFMRGGTPAWVDRGHFYATMASAMRHILCDYARKRKAAKRGSNCSLVALAESEIGTWDRTDQILAIQQALDRLNTQDARCARVVDLKVFGGLTSDQCAEILGVSMRTVKRDWEFALAWLYAEMTGSTEKIEHYAGSFPKRRESIARSTRKKVRTK